MNFNNEQFLSNLSPDSAWSFSESSQKDTNYITHGYHKYPAKYIPQLARKLILENSEIGYYVLDPFGGCGTTAVEAKINGRKSLSLDINPVATMISNAKITAIPHELLNEQISLFWKRHQKLEKWKVIEHERIDHWFNDRDKISNISKILAAIDLNQNETSNFFLCAFSNILKNCSLWSMKSNKPFFDRNKINVDPETQFKKQLNTMVRKNLEYCEILKKHNQTKTKAIAITGDAQKIPVGDNKIDLIVTSPPYVTSYEYADIHQLTALWLGYMDNLSIFRKDFIGSAGASRSNENLNSQTALNISNTLYDQNKPLGKKTAVYFSDMYRVFTDMKRVLRKDGKASIVIGDTQLRGVKISNTKVFMEQLEHLGFSIENVISRKITSKLIPSTRDIKTGKFASVKSSDKISYPVEFIIIARNTSD